METKKDFKNNLAFFVCPNCLEEIVVTVSRASLVRTLNPHWLDQKAKVRPVVDTKNHACLFSSDFDLYIKNYVKRRLVHSRGSISRASELAGISKAKFYKLMKKYDLVLFADHLRQINNVDVDMSLANAYQ